MEAVGTLLWGRNDSTPTLRSELQEELTKTLFALTKSATTDRVISWSLVPKTHSRKCPSHFAYRDAPSFPTLLAEFTNPLVFYFHVDTWFHSASLPLKISYVFPMPRDRVNLLTNALREHLSEPLQNTRSDTY